MTRLSVNLNKVALLRNQRDVGYPSVTEAAAAVLEAGADGITLHPRPDRRHVRREDVAAVAALLGEGRAEGLNVEGYPSPAFLALAAAVRPGQVTLVPDAPDAPDARTSCEGWRLAATGVVVRQAVAALRPLAGRIALLIDPDPAAPAMARACGADAVEIFTGGLVLADPAETLERCRRTAAAAADVGLAVHAGHDLSLDNLGRFLGAVPACAEVSIGHALVADALRYGWRDAVAAYRGTIAGAASASCGEA